MCYIFVGIGVGMFNVFFVVILYYNIINIWIFYYFGSFFILLFLWMGCDNDWNILRCFYRLLIMIQWIDNDIGYDLFNVLFMIL